MLIQDAFTSVVDRLASPPSGSAPVEERQSGAIPYSIVENIPVFLLITSRRTGRWIFPKGVIQEGLDPAESAKIEALEEAGVEGSIGRISIGSYRSWKTRGVRRFVIEVDMYPLRVERQIDNWPEIKERHRHWVTLTEARRLIIDKRLVELAGIIANQARDDTPLQTPAA